MRRRRQNWRGIEKDLMPCRLSGDRFLVQDDNRFPKILYLMIIYSFKTNILVINISIPIVGDILQMSVKMCDIEVAIVGVSINF